MLVSKTTEVCEALSHSTRYYILRSLVAAGEDGLSQRQLKLKVALSRAAIKRHVDQLEKIGIVHVERQSRAVIYRANPVMLADFFDTLKRHLEPTWVLRMVNMTPGDAELPSLREKLDEALPEIPDSKNQSAHNIKAVPEIQEGKEPG